MKGRRFIFVQSLFTSVKLQLLSIVEKNNICFQFQLKAACFPAATFDSGLELVLWMGSSC